MNSEKKILRCDECNTILKTGIPDQDSRCQVWCRNCGLVYEPNHPMGHGFTGLKDYMLHYGLNDYMDDVRTIFTVECLAKARLYVSKL